MSQEDRAVRNAEKGGRMKACEVPRFPQATASCNPEFAPNIPSRSVSTEETGSRFLTDQPLTLAGKVVLILQTGRLSDSSLTRQP
jgi:hypothetical protein